MTNSSQKNLARKFVKKRFANVSKLDWKNKNDLLSLQLIQFLGRKEGFLKSSLDCPNDNLRVGAYAPMSTEANWYSEGLNQLEIKWAFPRFTAQGEMDFFFSGIKELIPSNCFGPEILVPPRDAKIASKEELSCLLIPGIAFDTQGDRLGKGGGYYDRYLKMFTGFKIGICLEEQILEKVPSCNHDMAMDYVVTDKQVYDFRT